jgi:hypothetical protein
MGITDSTVHREKSIEEMGCEPECSERKRAERGRVPLTKRLLEEQNKFPWEIFIERRT